MTYLRCTMIFSLPVKNEQRQTNSGYDSPSQQAVKLQLQFLGDPVVSHEGIQYPKSDVGKQ